MLRGVKGGKHGYKKAIVTLEKGYKIEILPH
jgi:ribosomal protein L23